ncbi:MAG: DUF2796 domain-containing protein [Deltaproteobacteria bacterium]|jgi:hypothetical protein|nr:DUF2796 domain-containing protein [Deltaproteobacteria bacterium]
MSRNIFLLALIPFWALAFASNAMGQGETHPAHVHGVASLNVAIEADGVDIDFDGPLASFISFESAPSSPAQEAEMKAMVDTLQKSADLFKFPASLGCAPREVNIEGANIPEAILGHPHGAEGHGHGDEDGDHDHGDEDGDHEHADGEEHSDIEVEFSFSCSSIATAPSGEIAVELFGAFPLLKELDVQMVSPGGQKGMELTAEANVIKW